MEDLGQRRRESTEPENQSVYLTGNKHNTKNTNYYFRRAKVNFATKYIVGLLDRVKNFAH